MLVLEDWIVEPKFFKMYLHKGPEHASFVEGLVHETRSMPAGWKIAVRRTAHAVAWKI